MRFDYRCLQQQTGTWVCIKSELALQRTKVLLKTEREAQILKSQLPLCRVSLATIRVEKQWEKADTPSKAALSRRDPAEQHGCFIPPCGELQHFTHPKTEALVYAEPLSHFRALFVFVQYIS